MVGQNKVVTNKCSDFGKSKIMPSFQQDYNLLHWMSREAVRLLVNKFRETGSILDKKRNLKQHVLTEQKLEEIGESLENSPQKSLRRLAQETDISKASAIRRE